MTHRRAIRSAFMRQIGPVQLYRSDGGDHWVHAPEHGGTRPRSGLEAVMFRCRWSIRRTRIRCTWRSIVSWGSTDAGKTWQCSADRRAATIIRMSALIRTTRRLLRRPATQWRGYLAERGESWAEWYCDGADVSRDCGQCVSVSGVRRGAHLGSARAPSRSNDGGGITFFTTGIRRKNPGIRI